MGTVFKTIGWIQTRLFENMFGPASNVIEAGPNEYQSLGIPL